MLIREVMSSPAVTIRLDATAREAIQLLTRHQITAMPVIDDTGLLVGVISEADLLDWASVPDPRAHLIPKPLPVGPEGDTVRERMTRDPFTVGPDLDLGLAVRIMIERLVKSLPVVEDGQVVGVVSRRDVIESFSHPDEPLHEELTRLFAEAGLAWAVTVDDGLVIVTGPMTEREEQMAQAMVGTMPGVTGVRFVDGRSED